MKVTAINYTGKGQDEMAAADLLIFTKNTRLTVSPDGYVEIKNWPIQKKMEELEYMSRSIPSSWEFVDMTFLIENVSRAFCQQMTRTRTGSYAMSSQRVVNQSGFSYTMGPSASNSLYVEAMDSAAKYYDKLVEGGVTIEDARGVLPINIHSNIIAKFNLRTLSDMAKSRTGQRTQSEYRDVFDEMSKEILSIWPWANLFLYPSGKEATKPLDDLILNAHHAGLITTSEMMDCHKSIDLLKKGKTND